MVEDAAKCPVRVSGFWLGDHGRSIWVYWSVKVSSTENKAGELVLKQDINRLTGRFVDLTYLA